VQRAVAFPRAEQRAVLASNIPQLAERLETERDQTIYYIAEGSNGRAGDLSTTASPGVRKAAAEQYRVIQAFYGQTDQTVAQFRTRLEEFQGAYTGTAQQGGASAAAGLNMRRHLRRGSTRT